MKIAVASSDGVSISRHFGRSRCFIVFQTSEGKITDQEVRDNTYTAHTKGQHTQVHDHDTPHSHADIVSALRDCQAVISYGMGRRAAEELKASGIQPLIIGRKATSEEAVQAFLEGKLNPLRGFCRCDQ